jgi:5-carboxymethyl-2-hydroxymuconate isomerase
MPQITVDYSAPLEGSFDRRGFASALHAEVVEIAGARIESCKTQFRRTEDTTVGADLDGHAVVHITLALLAGRTEETKVKLSETTLELVRQYLKPAAGLALHVSAEVRDLEPSYRKSES